MIFWIASYPKSGNTWLRMFLSAYRNGGEIDINNPVGFRFGYIQSRAYNTVLGDVLLENATEYDLMRIRTVVLIRMAMAACETKEPLPIFVKTHFANGTLSHVRAILPSLTAGALYVVRDPRDVAVSWAAHTDRSIDKAIAHMADPKAVIRSGAIFHWLGHWSQNVLSWSERLSYRVGVVRYEDLISKPVDSFRKVVTFLGWAVDEALLEKSVEACAFENLRAQEMTGGFGENTTPGAFFRNGKAGAWREHLSDRQAALLMEAHGEVMKKFGYGAK